MLRQQWVDGIFLATQPLPEAAWRELHFGRTPVVIMDRGQLPRQAQASLVGFDWTMAGHQAAQHLLALGHRRIGFVGGIPGRSSRRPARERLSPGACRIGRRIRRGACTATATISRKVAAFCAAELLRLPARERPTALVMGNDMMAPRRLRGRRATGPAHPRMTISITGIDDNFFAAHMAPPLTTVHVPTLELGREGMRMLVNGEAGAQRVSLPTRLVTRSSTAAPNPAERDFHPVPARAPVRLAAAVTHNGREQEKGASADTSVGGGRTRP